MLSETKSVKWRKTNENAMSRNIRTIKVVHISDTHMNHDALIPLIPDGDILIHSGDFINYYKPLHKRELKEWVQKINTFFSQLPHKHKIFVAGNHDTPIYKYAGFTPEVVSKLLTNGVYLCDNSVVIEGLTIYGTPWNNAHGMAFFSSNLKAAWAAIPTGVDILVTHLPPFGILDFGYNKYWGISEHEQWKCDLCTEESGKIVMHGDWAHHGCIELRREVLTRIRPKVHMFGHIHNKNGISEIDGIVFSNGSMQCVPNPIVLNINPNR